MGNQEKHYNKPGLLTFENVARDWHRVMASGTWSVRHTGDVMQKLERDLLPAIGHIPIKDVTSQDCVAVARAIEKRGSLEQARRTIGVASQIFEYSITLELRSFNPIPSIKKNALVKRVAEHYPSIKWDEMPELLAAFETNPGGADRMTILGLRLLMLTFVRTTELIGADWKEIDWDTKLWTIPAARMKGKIGKKQNHLVPLSTQAVETFQELRDITGPDGLIFKSIRTKTGYISNNTLNMALKRT